MQLSRSLQLLFERKELILLNKIQGKWSACLNCRFRTRYAGTVKLYWLPLSHRSRHTHKHTKKAQKIIFGKTDLPYWLRQTITKRKRIIANSSHNLFSGSKVESFHHFYWSHLISGLNRQFILIFLYDWCSLSVIFHLRCQNCFCFLTQQEKIWWDFYCMHAPKKNNWLVEQIVALFSCILIDL